MSQNTKTTAPQQPAATQPAAAPTLPVLTLFGLHKRNGQWIAVAVQTQGQNVLRTKVIETDKIKEHTRLCLDKEMFRFYDQDVDIWEGVE